MNKTIETAKRIAGYGAAKMDSQGYKIERMGSVEGAFYVIKPAQGEETKPPVYLTTVRGEFTSCTCPFHAENGVVCKHTERVAQRIEEDARADAEWAYLGEIHDARAFCPA